jgi:hypothetical protein
MVNRISVEDFNKLNGSFFKTNKKDTRKSREKELEDLWRELIKLRVGYKCEYPNCPKTEHLNSHHIYSRIHKSTKYDPDNGMCLCAGHHTLTSLSAHHDPDFKEIIIKNGIRTAEFYQKLKMRAFTPAKIDINLIKLDLENELRKYSK